MFQYVSISLCLQPKKCVILVEYSIENPFVFTIQIVLAFVQPSMAKHGCSPDPSILWYGIYRQYLNVNVYQVHLTKYVKSMSKQTTGLQRNILSWIKGPTLSIKCKNSICFTSSIHSIHVCHRSVNVIFGNNHCSRQ